MKYPGGKGKCFQRLINLMPQHDTYIESHLGGGAVLRAKRPARVNIGVDADAQVIDRWRREPPAQCQLVHADAASFLERHDYTGSELVYADPPYLAQTRRNPKIYRHEYTASDHERLLDVLRSLPCMVMISGYDSALYRKRLAEWRTVTFQAKTHVDTRNECVWLNFDAPSTLHDYAYLGTSFRDRQTIKRRSTRLIARFEQMNPIERSQLLQLLNERFNPQQAPA